MADKIGVTQDEWNSAVNSGASSVSSVAGVTVKDLEKTTLARFKAIIELEKTVETTLANYKGYNASSTNKMIEVGQKIVDEDAAFGQSFDENTANVRFK